MDTTVEKDWDDSLKTLVKADLQAFIHWLLGKGEYKGGATRAALHQTVIDIVLERFPKLVRFTRKQLVFADDPAILRHLIVKLSISKTAEEARQYLQEVDEEEEED